jgi:hypothetical protein
MLAEVNHVGPRRSIVDQLNGRDVTADDIDTVLFRYVSALEIRCSIG